MMRLIIALALLASTAGAETLHQGRVYQTTADRYQAREQMACTYGPYRRFITLADGRLALIRIKRCEKVSKQ
jgi:hypothetical protein